MFTPPSSRQSGAAEAFDKSHTGFSSQHLHMGDIWLPYLRGALSEQALLQALAKRVAEFAVPHLDEPGKFAMATLLAQSPWQNKHDVALAIDALLDWAEENGITVVDGHKGLSKPSAQV